MWWRGEGRSKVYLRYNHYPASKCFLNQKVWCNNLIVLLIWVSLITESEHFLVPFWVSLFRLLIHILCPFFCWGCSIFLADGFLYIVDIRLVYLVSFRHFSCLLWCPLVLSFIDKRIKHKSLILTDKFIKQKTLSSPLEITSCISLSLVRREEPHSNLNREGFIYWKTLTITRD